jgi:hypothetical protein
LLRLRRDLQHEISVHFQYRGKLSRQASKVRAMHAAEVLAGMSDTAIGEEE